MLTLLAVFAMMQPKASAFPLSEVNLLEGPFKQAMLRNADVLLSLDPDRLLFNTRKYAGLEPKGKIYGGWESAGIAGHTLGHYLTALSQQAAATGDVRFHDRVAYIVHEMAVCQKLYGDGYVGALPPLELATLRGLREGKVNVDSAFFFKGGAWVPWYTQHKVLAGLKDAWLVAGVKEAKEVTLHLADWVDDVTKNLTPEQLKTMLSVEHGGMMETLIDLFSHTQDYRYLAVSKRFYHHAVLDPLLAGRDELPGRHANTQIPKVIGMARAYEVEGDSSGRKIAETFWNLVTDKYTFAIGGNSDHEHFFRQEDAAEHLSPNTAETCNTYNMLKLTEHLFEWSPDVRYADFYERALFNHILASQDPKTGMYAYFMSLKPGHFRTFSTLDDSFWCCFGSGMENHTKYGEGIYFKDADGVYVNQFISSKLNWTERGLVLEQLTDYPHSEIVKIAIDQAPSTSLAVHFRNPSWAKTGTTLTLNGQPLHLGSAPGTYSTIHRVWHKGDVLEARIPMEMRLEPLAGAPKKMAFMYGPMVIAGDFGPSPAKLASNQSEYAFSPTPVVPPLLSENSNRDGYHVGREGHGDKWQIAAADGSVISLRPYTDLAGRRTTVYWDFLTASEYAVRKEELRRQEETARRDLARTIDSYSPGEQQSEVDHRMLSENAFSGDNSGKKWRDAQDGGWFSFQMKVLPKTVQMLRFTFWGGDQGRTFDILVNGKKLVTYHMDGSRAGQFYTVDFPLEVEQIENKDTVLIRFQSSHGGTAGGLYGALVMKAAD